MSSATRPALPKPLDDALFLAMLDAVGETLAFRAVDAAWRALCDCGIVVTRSGADGLREVLEIEVHQ